MDHNFSLQVFFSCSSLTSTGHGTVHFMLLTTSGETTVRRPSTHSHDYRHHRVSQQPSIAKKDYSIIQLRKMPPRASWQNDFNLTKKKRTEERISEVPPCGVFQSQPLALRMLQECACAPVNKPDHQCWTATHADTVNRGSRRPHKLRVISVVGLLDAKLAHSQWPPSRSRVATNGSNAPTQCANRQEH